MTNYEKIKEMTVDQMAMRFATSFSAGALSVLEKLNFPKHAIDVFMTRIITEAVITYKDYLEMLEVPNDGT